MMRPVSEFPTEARLLHQPIICITVAVETPRLLNKRAKKNCALHVFGTSEFFGENKHMMYHRIDHRPYMRSLS